MAKINTQNPSGIEFDDAGPGAGTSIPPALAAKVAKVAAKAKPVPSVKAAKKTPVPKSAPAPKKGTRIWNMATVERYKGSEQLTKLETEGNTIHTIVPSVATQNSYDVFYFKTV